MMRKIFAPAALALTMAMSGAASADIGSNSAVSSMAWPNVYAESMTFGTIAPRTGSVEPMSDIRSDLYHESSQMARMPVSAGAIEPDAELDESVYGTD